jgi:prepilin-type N-terminal cleavage/methylation domain-containing protein
MRRGFSLVEVLITLVLVGMFAVTATQYLGEEPEEALVTRAKAELAAMKRVIQGRTLRAPNYHFDTLREALGLEEAPRDPWGNPYILFHGPFRYGFRAEVDRWDPDTQDALYTHAARGERGEVMLDHWILSAGPNRALLHGEEVGPGGTRLVDLMTKLRLGRPEPKVVALYDDSPPDGDLVTIQIGDREIVSGVELPPYPGIVREFTLNPGMNHVFARAHPEKAQPGNSASVEIADPTSGTLKLHFAPRAGTHHSECVWAASEIGDL